MRTLLSGGHPSFVLLLGNHSPTWPPVVPTSIDHYDKSPVTEVPGFGSLHARIPFPLSQFFTSAEDLVPLLVILLHLRFSPDTQGFVLSFPPFFCFEIPPAIFFSPACFSSFSISACLTLSTRLLRNSSSREGAADPQTGAFSSDASFGTPQFSQGFLIQ